MRRLSMPTSKSLRGSLRGAVLAATFAVATLVTTGLSSGTAQAGVAMPSIGSTMPTIQTTENVRWVCGPFRCFWRPNFRYWYVPPYARGWGPPVAPNCFWRRGWGGWAHVCP